MSNGTSHQRAYTPPIPALEIRLQEPVDGGQSAGPLIAVLDTGADISLVPIPLLEQIKAPEQDEVRLRSHWGEVTSFTTYLVSIQLGSEILPGIEVVGDLYGQEVLLGRDVLNKLLLLIDGPQQQTDILTRRPRRLV